MPRPKAVTSTAKSAADTAEDTSFVDTVEAELMALLAMPLEPKEKNAIITNAIRFIATKNRLRDDDDGSFFGN